MKNITVSVDEGTYRTARIRAAELDTSVSALVRAYLRTLAAGRSEGGSAETEAERRSRLLREIVEEITADGGGLHMADNLSREELHDRDAARAEAERERQRRMPA